MSVQAFRRNRVYLQVPFQEKDIAKGLGAWWDPAAKKWYVPPGLSLWNFVAWLPPEEKAEFEAEKRRQAEYSRRAQEWQQLEPRWTDPAVILSKLDRPPVYRKYAFCIACDSHFAGWYVDKIELRHLADFEGSTFRPSEMTLLQRALNEGLLEHTKRRGFAWLRRRRN